MKSKLYLALFALGLFVFASCSEEGLNPRDIPNEIMDDFNQRHPDASKIEWEREGDLWEAEFQENGIEVGILYAADFTWIRTEYERELTDLPQAAVDYIETNLPGGKLDEVEYFESSNEGDGYIAEVVYQKNEHEIFFDLDGNFIREEIEKDDGD